MTTKRHTPLHPEEPPRDRCSGRSQSRDKRPAAAAAAASESRSAARRMSPAGFAAHCRLGATTSGLLGPRRLLAGALLCTVGALLLGPQTQPNNFQSVEGLKALKALAKTFVYQQLTQRKNFVPLPVPIPGKWQTLLNTVVDSGLLKGARKHHHQVGSSSSKAVATAAAVAAASPAASAGVASLLSRLPALKFDSEKQHKFSSFSSDSSSKKLLLFGAGNLVDQLSQHSAKLNKLLSNNAPSSGSASSSSSSAAAAGNLDMNNVKKLTRLAAAKYAGYLINQQAHGKRVPATNGQKSPAPSPSLIQKATAASTSASENKRNDVLVTAFNVVKLAQQIRELDANKVLRATKKSSYQPQAPPSSAAAAVLSAATSGLSPNAPTLLSMNIDNRKTLFNKMHYIHRLTSDLHHRHRNNQKHLA